MSLDASELEALVLLAEELHFGRAAARLHVSQPALSKQIQRIEEKVGGALFSRGYRDVRLTEAGRLLVERARRLIADAADALELSRRVARGEVGSLRVGFGLATIFDLLPDVLLRFRATCPGVDVRLRDMSTPAQVEALAREQIDLGFVRLPVGDEALETRPVLDERLVAALGPRARWPTRQRLAGLAREPFIVCARSTSASYYDHVLSLCRSSGFTPTIVQETNELSTVLALVRAGIGVALVPSAAALLRPPGIRFRELYLPDARWNIGLAWRRGRADDPLILRFVQIATSYRRPGALKGMGRSPTVRS